MDGYKKCFVIVVTVHSERERESSFLTTHQHIIGYTVSFALYMIFTRWTADNLNDRWQATETKYNPEKLNNTKYSTTKLPWFSGHLPHSARKRGGLILQLPSPHGATVHSLPKYCRQMGHAFTLSVLYCWLVWCLSDLLETLLTGAFCVKMGTLLLILDSCVSFHCIFSFVYNNDRHFLTQLTSVSDKRDNQTTKARL